MSSADLVQNGMLAQNGNDATAWDNATSDSQALKVYPIAQIHHETYAMRYGVEFSNGLVICVDQSDDTQDVVIIDQHENERSYLGTWEADHYNYTMEYNNGCTRIKETHHAESPDDRTTLVAFADGSAVTHVVEDFEHKLNVTKLAFGDNVITVAFRQDEDQPAVMLIKHETPQGGEVVRFTNGELDFARKYKNPQKDETSQLTLSNLFKPAL